jgi:hypothetical protein
MLNSNLVPVIKEGRDYVIIENKAESRLAIRKPLSGRWKEIRNHEDILIALELKAPGATG